jgi:SAM-dependent methyltransferase
MSEAAVGRVHGTDLDVRETDRARSARACPCCGTRTSRYLGDKYNWQWRECAFCHAVFSASLPAQEESDVFYDAYYRGEGAVLDTPPFVRARLRTQVAGMETLRRHNRFLDVGCGVGALVKEAQALGWQAEGTEVASGAVDYARARGLSIHQGTLDRIDLEEGGYDIVAALEVIEHVPDPRQFVRQAMRLLRPGGLLWMTTPNGASLTRRVLGLRWHVVAPEHLQLLTPRSIRWIGRNQGLARRDLRLLTHGINPFEIAHQIRLGRAMTSSDTPESAEGDSETSSNAGHDAGGVPNAIDLNERFSSGPRKLAKEALNATLNAARWGESLKIFASKPSR